MVNLIMSILIILSSLAAIYLCYIVLKEKVIDKRKSKIEIERLDLINLMEDKLGSSEYGFIKNFCSNLSRKEIKMYTSRFKKIKNHSKSWK